MARAFSLSLSLSRSWSTLVSLSPSSRLLPMRFQSSHHRPNHVELSDIDTASSDPLLRKLEDAIHGIIVQRSAPDWLPFVPGASYWVPPPRSQTRGIAQIIEKLANPLTPDELRSTINVRGWPSSDYFIRGGQSYPIDEDMISNSPSHNEDEEG